MEARIGILFLAGWMAVAALPGQEYPPQRVHREGFVPTGDEIFAVVSQFYDFDEALPLDARTVDRWEEETSHFENIVFTTSSGERVPGDLVLPAGGEPPYPAALLIHGLNSDRDRWWRADREALPGALLAAGVAVLTIDLRYHGARAAANDYEPPAYLTMGQKLFVRNRDMVIQSAIDCRRALGLLAARPEIDAARVGVVGYSMGAIIGLYLSALEPDLAAVVAAAVPTGVGPLPTDHFNFAARASMPILLLVGRSDWLSSPADVELLRDLVPRDLARLRFYDAGHRLPPEFASDAATWLLERLALD